MVILVPIEQALLWLRLRENTSQYDLIEGLVIQAQDVVLDYIGTTENDWTPETVPPRITAAIMLVVVRLHAADDGPVITDAIKSLLRRDRKPVVA